MSKRTSKQILAMLMALAMIITCLVTPGMAAPAAAKSSESSEAVRSVKAVNDKRNGVSYVEGTTLDPNQEMTIMVRLEGNTVYQQTGDLQLAVANSDAHVATLAKAENRIEANLHTSIDVENTYNLLFNGFSFTGEAWMIDAINEMAGVTAFEAPVFELIDAEVSDPSSLTPSMSTSTGMTRASAAWDLGYTGKGTVIAVIDTGIRATHEAFSVMPENGKIDMDYLKQVYADYGQYLHAGTAANLDDIYENEKLPFNWDYFDGDAIPNHTASDHGTHVAGIAAGNNGSNFKGVAPDAQIVTMQVFTDAGGAGFDTLMCAMEDCVYLGVDAINMSLGSAAGYTAYESVIAELEDIYAALENAGVSVAAASGNDGFSTVWTNYGDWFYSQYRWPAANPDVGLIGSPATFVGSFGVASVQNSSVEGGGYLNAYGRDYYPATISDVPSLGELEGGEYDIVFAGLGSPEEITAAGGVEGKIALVQRGTLTFSEKCENAAAAGAAAVIIFNNAAGAFNPSVSSSIPFGAMTLEDGNLLISHFADGVNGKVTVVNGFAYGTVAMATSSSWGTTADLRIAPEIAAPGDNITSSIGFGEDNSYATWSGTSMATPHIAGGLVLIKERLRQDFPNADAAKINELAYAFMMSTAHQVQGFVRQQGAGLMDVAAALTTDAYLTVPGANRPKLELDDSEDGVFTFSFEVNNIGDATKTYTISPSILTESIADFEYSGYVMTEWDYAQESGYFIANPETKTVKTMSGVVKDVTHLCSVTAPELVTVPAGETVTVEMTIACNDELMQYFEENCPSGMYLEGFIKLVDQADDGVDLSVPFLGYVGDWDYPSMLDRGFYWQLPFGVNNDAQMTTSHGSYIGYGVLEQGLGLNFYADMTGKTYLPDRNAISPNGDGFLDAVDYMEFSYLRNPKTVKLYVQDEEGNVLKTLYESRYNFRKEYWTGSFNGGVTFSSLVFDYAAEELAENETAYIVLESWLDHEGYDPADNESGYWITPVTKDLTAPAVRVVDGGIEIIDANYTAYYAIYADAERTQLLYETGVFADQRGVPETYLTDAQTLYVATADYARNEAFYLVENGVVYQLDEDGFGHDSKTIIAQQHINYIEGVYQYGWNSFSPETPNALTPLTELSYALPYHAAEFYNYDVLSTAVGVDGTLYANDLGYLYTMDPETFERTEIGLFWNADSSEPAVRNIMVNPETYEMYAYAFLSLPDELGGSGRYFCSLDPKTAEVTPLWQLAETYETYWSWALTIKDANTVIVYDSRISSIVLLDIQDGTFLKRYETNLHEPTYNTAQVGSAGVGGNMIYDADQNCVYISSDWSWFRADRYSCTGMIEYDFDTETTTLHSTGTGAGMVLYGMYFAEDVKPADFYTVMMLIDAIGEVTQESGEAIRAAREAYDALPEQSKSRVENYQTLLDAEQAFEPYALLDAARAAQKAAEEAQKKAEEAQKAAEAAQKAAEEAAASTAEDKAAAEAAKAAAEAAQAKAEAAKAAAEAAQTAAEAAAQAAEASNLAAAQEAAKAAQEALKAAQEASNAAQSAEAAAEAQRAAQAAQAKAEEAQKKAEEAQKAAEEAAASAAEDKTAAEAARVKAEEAKAQAEAAQAAAEAAKTAAEAASTAAENAKLAAAEEARKSAEEAAKSAAAAAAAAESAAQAAEAMVKAQAAQAAAEAAAKTAEEAQKKAEEAQKKAEEAAQSSAEDKEAAEKAAQEAKAAKEAAENAQKSAEEAKRAAETAKEAAEAANVEAAASAALAAEYAQKVTETYNEIVKIKAEMVDFLAEAQKAAEQAEAERKAAEEARKKAEEAALQSGKYHALIVLSTYADKNDYAPAQQEALAAAIQAGQEAIDAATTLQEVEEALAAVKAAIDSIPTLAELMPFTDVKEGAWYYEAVLYAMQEGYFKGVTATTFAPESKLSRAMAVTVLYRMAGEPEVTGTTTFTDVKKDAYYYQALVWAVQNGIATGMDDTRFAPNANVTREQLVTFLYRYAKASGADMSKQADLSKYRDVNEVSNYAKDAMAWAVGSGILQGMEQNRLAPLGTATRAQAATILMRYSELA